MKKKSAKVDVKALMAAIDQQAVESQRVGPDWLRSEHTADEFNEAFTARVRAAVPRLARLERAMLHGTTSDGKEVWYDFRTRMSGAVVYTEGTDQYSTKLQFDVEPKDYGGSLARFKTMVKPGHGLASPKAVAGAKKEIEDLFS